MAAADACRLHGARGGKIGGAKTHAVHARRGGGDRLDIVHALRRFQDGVDHDRLCDLVPRFELRQQLVEIMDVPGTIDLGQHDDVELVADCRDDLGDVVERPGRIERIDARPQSGRPKSTALPMAMKPERAASFASIGMASSRLPSTTSTWRASSGTLARTFSLCGGTKWIMRSSRTGNSRIGAGAPMASGWKNWRGGFTRDQVLPKVSSAL